MIALNELEKIANERNEKEQAGSVSRADFESFLKLLAPFAPHVTEELWMGLGNKKSIHVSSWPVFDPALARDEEVRIIVQVNGKVRGAFIAAAGTGKSELEAAARGVPELKKWLDGKKVGKIIVVPDRLVNIVLTD